MKKKRPKILACDDNLSILEVIRTILTSEGYDVLTAENGEEAVRIFKKELPDLIILDVSMPGMTGLEALDKIRAFAGEKYIPVIFMTASIKIDDKLRALHGGAVDYLVKPVDHDELIARIKNFLVLKEKHDKLKKEATFDWMTGAFHKVYFLRRAEEELFKCLRNKIPLTFILMDVDNFKEINDTLGHLTGDKVIREFAARLKKMVRKIDLIGRFGGDEFMIMLSYKTATDACVVAERLKKAMKKPIVVEGNKISITFSMGIVEPKQGKEAKIEEVFKEADRALYEAKSKGGDRYVIR